MISYNSHRRKTDNRVKRVKSKRWIECPYCYCPDIVKDGHMRRKKGRVKRVQKYQCRGCGRRFILLRLPPKISKKIGMRIMELHHDGHTYRLIRDSLLESHGVKISHQTINRYIKGREVI